jgi:DNA-directed RNA polymerase I subunit RPA12
MSNMMTTESDQQQTARFEFCPDCGAVLDLIATDLSTDTIKCMRCMSSHSIDLFLGLLSTSRIVFNDPDQARKAYNRAKKKEKRVEDEATGPVVEMECPKCKHNRMSYKTLQLRSADEGQTVFFSCLKCGAQFSENS